MDVNYQKIWTITYLFRDGGKGKSTCTVHFPATAIDPNDPDPNPTPEPILIQAVKDWAEEMAELLEDMTEAGIEWYTLTLKALNNDYEKPDKDVDVEEKGEFIFQVEGGWQTSVSVPGLDETMLDEDGETIDTSVTAVRANAFINKMVDPWGPDLYEPCDRRGFDIVRFVEANKVHSRSQKPSRKRKG